MQNSSGLKKLPYGVVTFQNFQILVNLYLNKGGNFILNVTWYKNSCFTVL